ncbi:hypothetical protein I302_101972 [Kwoniella bestiolae CBS 10118]|uniref:Uncharacterized protein n=1 Tax=Kwoniella bestiolae CBS 10118 TaxID=1296100 RepID=A0A1B9GDQ4_9TREE|nr:hypothetical protein I302_00656 [Kwoniella bestiolae CBS 10118]OCF29160.1 hypothetical protein I302_00656 [Kwoniella bestiolae CBS 10118]
MNPPPPSPITSLFLNYSSSSHKPKHQPNNDTPASTNTLATLPSTPPLPPPLLSGTSTTFSTPFTPAQPGFQPQYTQDPQYTDPSGSGGGDHKTGADPWAFNAFSSPPSPSTITSTSDSQTGGDTFPPSDTGEGESSSSRSGSFRRQNLSLNISSLPTPFQNASIQSPGSLASSGAPFTDSFTSSHNVNFDQEYFHFPDGSFSSTGEGSLAGQIPLVPQGQQLTHRLPASQPSSPVRGVYPLPFGNHQAGRQRGATFSGGSFYPYDQTGSPVFTFTQNIPPQAIPPHLTFTNIQSPIHSPLAPSPIISASPAQIQTDNSSFFPVQTQPQGLGVQEVLMEDVSTPTPAVQPPTLSRKSSLGQLQQQQAVGSMTPELSMEMIDKLSLLDKIVISAQSAKDALLRGEQVDVSASLGDINHQLEIASELGVGPAPTPRDLNTPNSQSVSPVNNFTTSPTVQSTPGMSQAYSNPIVPNTVPAQMQSMQPMQQGLLPSLPVDGSSVNANRAVSATPLAGGNPNKMMAPATPADFLNGNKAQAPPLVHSHSFPNGHQLPSQMQGTTMTPSTPVVPSPSFIAAIGAQHAPIVSSPLATIPPSRPPSPPRYTIPAQPWNSEMMPQMDMSTQPPLQIPVNLSIPVQPPQQQSVVLERRPSQSERADGLPISRNRSTSVHKQWAHPMMTTSLPPSAWQSRQGSPEDMDEDDSEDEGPRKNKRRRSSAGGDGGPPNADLLNGALISEDIRRQMDQIFEEFLNRVCSDLDICDSKGEKLHQVLMPKKMQRLDESTDYRPFKFRIQAFTNAFTEELQHRGISEETMSVKKIKTYLWKQDLISRFNPDGKKAKSKGNHIWNVDAKKLPGGGWVFRPFKRRIIGQPNSFALVNQKYEWEPRIWDPQAASDTIKPSFHSPPGGLPSWLRWEESTKLVGLPDQPTGPLPITVIAEFVDGSGNQTTLETTFTIQVVPHLLPLNDTTAMYAQAGFIPFDFPDQANGQPVAMINQQGMSYTTGTMVYPQPAAQNGFPGQQ